MSWYVVRVSSGREVRLSQQISHMMERAFSGELSEVLVPIEKSIEMVRGERVEVEKVCFPGYVYLKVAMNAKIQRAILNLTGVHSFLGAEEPTKVLESEIQNIKGRMRKSEECPKMSVSYEVGDQVRVRTGPFSSMSGSIEEIDMDADRVKVSIPIFGRATPVELETSAIEKVWS